MQQLTFVGEDLHPVLHAVGYPHMSVAIDGDALGSRKVAGPVAVLAPGANEHAIGIEDLDAIVQGVGDVEIALLIDSQTRGLGEVAGIRQRVIFARSADVAQQLETVGVVNQHDVLLYIGDVEQAILGVDGQPARFDHAVGDDIRCLVIFVEDEDVVQPGIGDEQAVVVVHRQADDAVKVSIDLVLDQSPHRGFRC